MKISTRLRLAVYVPALMAFVIVAALVFSYQEMLKIQENGDRVRQIRSSITELNHFVFSYILYYEERPKEQFLAEHNTLTQLIAGAKIQVPEQQRLLESIRTDSEAMKDLFLQLVSNYEHYGTVGMEELQVTQGRLVGLLLLKSYEADSYATLLRRLVDDGIRVTETWTSGLIFLVIVLATVPLTIVLARTRRSITSSLSNLSKGTTVIGSGNLDFKIEEMRNDEIGDLSRAFNQMAASLKNVTASKVVLENEISERKKAEEALKQSEERFAKAFRASPAAFAITRFADGIFVEVNDSFVHMFGYNADELIGHSSIELNMYPDPNERKELIDLLQEKGRVINQEMTTQTKAGHHFRVLFSMEIVNLHGEAHILTTLTDITERKKAELLKDEFIGMVSHELKTPITIVMGAIYTALSEGITEEEMKELLNDAASSTESLASIVDNLLELSRAQANRLMIRTEAMNIAQIAHKVVDKLKDRSGIHRLNVDIPEGLPTVRADLMRVERVLHNLIENAIKYSPQGGDITVFVQQSADCLTVGVKDQGRGISPEDQAKLFKPFERLGEANGISGVGLGLNVCLRLVEAQGGRIWIESEPGKGSTFFFTLPLG